MIRLVIALELLFLFTAPGKAAAQSCPPEYPDTRVLVERFLTRSAHQLSRQETGLTGASPGTIRLLVNGADDAVCQQLNTAVGSSSSQSGPWQWSYYTAGGRFFVALHYVDSAGTRRIGFVPLYVYDTQIRVLGTYAM